MAPPRNLDEFRQAVLYRKRPELTQSTRLQRATSGLHTQAISKLAKSPTKQERSIATDSSLAQPTDSVRQPESHVLQHQQTTSVDHGER
jgi:hypothetical protein